MTTGDAGKVTGEQRMLIDGKLVEARSGNLFDNLNPATEEVLGQVADAGHEDMDAAIAAARRAFDESPWSTDRELRKRCILQLQAALEEERELLRAELVAEVGTPVLLTYGPQLDAPLSEGLTWPANFIDEFAWERDLPEGTAFGTRSRRWVAKEAVGVVGAIVPWNFPFEVTVNKLGQALATGNTVILKAAPNTPWNATRIGRLVAERTDFPPGVLQVVTTADNTVAEDLVTDPRVDLISFTGSTAVGRRIMAQGAPTLKRLFLELGGKSADIVLEDADFEAKLAMAWTVCTHAGQGCVMLTRMLLPRSRYDEGIALIEAGFRNVPYGDPTDAGNLQGPQISAVQRDRVLGLHREGQGGGGTGGGGRRPTGPPRQGLLRRAHPLRRRGQLDDHRPGGDLRTGPGGGALRRRRRRRAHRQREPVRPRGGGDRGHRGAGHRRGQAGPGRHGRRSTAASGTGRTPPSAATRPAASAARTASRGSSSTSRPRPTPDRCRD